MDKKDAEVIIKETIEYANNEIKKNQKKMRRNVIICTSMIVCILAVLFFPFSKTRNYSGNGKVLNSKQEVTNECSMAVEVREWRSLVCRYKMNYTIQLNGIDSYVSDESDGLHHPTSFMVSEQGDYLISQAYYDEKTNSIKNTSLFCRGDQSMVEFNWDGVYYRINME